MNWFLNYAANTWGGWLLILVVIAVFYVLAVAFVYAVIWIIARYNALHYGAIDQKFREEYDLSLKRLTEQSNDEAEVVYRDLQQFMTEADLNQKHT